MVGVWALTVVLSVMSGFEADLKRKILGTNSHAWLMKYHENFREWRDTLKQFPFSGQTSTSALPAPACTKQAQQPSIGQIPEMSDYTHVYANP